MTEPKKAALALNEAEERLKLALQVSGLGIFDWLPMKGELLWDEKTREIFGASTDLQTSKFQFFFDVIHPDDKNLVQGHFTRLLDADDDTPAIHAKFRILKDGETRYLKTHGTIFRNEKGLIHRVIGTVQDITVQKKNTDQINLQAKILGSISEAIISTDSVFNIKTWNKGAEELYGWKSEEVIGKPMAEIVPVDYIDNNGEDVLAAFLREGKWRGQVIQLNKEKQPLYIQASLSAIYGTNGNMTGSIAVNQDISKRYQVELALRASEERYRSLVENTHDAIFCYEFEPPISIDLPIEEQVVRIYDGKLVECNNIAAQMHGFEFSHQIIGKKTTELFHIKPGDPTDALFTTFIENGYQNTNQEGVEVLPDGQKRYFSNNSHGVIENGKLVRSWGTYRNITEQKSAEIAIRNAKEYAENLIDTANVMVVGLDIEGRVQIFNKVAENISGYKKEEILNQVWFETIVPKEKYPLVWEKFDRINKGGVPKKFENPILTKSGKERLINWQNNDVIEDGKVVGTISFGIDVTEQKKAESILIKNEERFRTIFNQQFQFMAILTPEGVITEINDLPIKVHGSTKSAYIGKYFWDSPAWEHLPEERLRVKNQVLNCAAQPGPLLGVDKFHTSTGEIRYTTSAYSAIKDEEGNVKYLLVQATDITERKLAEEELKKTQEALSKVNYRFQISTQAAHIGIWDWDIPKDQLHWDLITHELYGLRKGQFQDNLNEWFQFIHPEDRQKIMYEVDMAVAGEIEFNTEFKIIWPDQSIRHIKATASVQTDANGKADRMIGTQWDITQEKEAEKQKLRTRQLEAQNKELERFAYVASHDLQEPLRTLKSFAKLLESNPNSTLSQKELVHLSYISQAANRMTRQIRDLLDYSRIGRNKKPKLVDCDALIKHALNDLSAQIEENQAIIKKDPLPMIIGYEMEIRVLFQNLISNGLKFHKKNEPPLIYISVEETKGYWIFCVKDNGIGIEPEFTEKVFLIFQRLNPRDEYEGSGIGLAHCYRIVDLHGGRIWAESVPGEGSSFFFTIPRVD